MFDENDVYIEMTPENLAKAIALAKAASHCTGHGPMKTEWLHDLAKDSEELSCAYLVDNGETVVSAITGNGPTSVANAEFYCSARAVIIGMAKRIKELESTRMVGLFSGGQWRRG